MDGDTKNEIEVENIRKFERNIKGYSAQKIINLQSIIEEAQKCIESQTIQRKNRCSKHQKSRSVSSDSKNSQTNLSNSNNPSLQTESTSLSHKRISQGNETHTNMIISPYNIKSRSLERDMKKVNLINSIKKRKTTTSKQDQVAIALANQEIEIGECREKKKRGRKPKVESEAKSKTETDNENSYQKLPAEKTIKRKKEIANHSQLTLVEKVVVYLKFVCTKLNTLEISKEMKSLYSCINYLFEFTSANYLEDILSMKLGCILSHIESGIEDKNLKDLISQLKCSIVNKVIGWNFVFNLPLQEDGSYPKLP